MAIAQYTDTFWFPTGVLATGAQVRIFPLNSNILAPLFADLAGTVPLANPMLTNGSGSITFYAEAGEYWLHIDTETFRIAVGLPEVTPGEIAALQADVLALQGDVSTLQTEMDAVEADVTAIQGAIDALDTRLDAVEAISSATISTGITAGGDISVNAGNSSAVDIAPFEGYFTDFITDPFNPTITPVIYPGAVGVAMDAGSLARTKTVWLIDSALNIVQQSAPPTNSQRRTHICIGTTTQVGGVITNDQSLPVILQQPANQLGDLLSSLGAFSLTGNRITPNGVNLSINQTAGTMFSEAFNHFVGVVQSNDPHVSNTLAQTPASVRYITSTSTVFGVNTTLLIPGSFDVGGVITPVGGGANSSTIQRVYLFPNNTASQQLVIQYGATTYASLAAATAAIGSGTAFVPNPLLAGSALIAYIAMIRTATNLSDPTQAAFALAGKFATP